MTQKKELRDLLIFLPGIMGSRLTVGGDDLWAVSGQALWQFFKTVPNFGQQLQSLTLHDDDYAQPDLGDGVVADALIMGDALIAPLIKIGGYGPIIERIMQTFAVQQGSIHAPQAHANFFPFPYDWRRDNRASALKLQQFIDAQLPRWRVHSGAKDAQVILIAHSMGGLVARHYVELLGGWEHCRTLITVGTPHRGSLNAVETLSSGLTAYQGLSPVVRSFTSLYQLLPIYEAICVDGHWQRVAETSAIPHIDQARAKAAREGFHIALKDAATTNRTLAGCQLPTLPLVGVQQDTLQSALIDSGQLTMSYALPPIVHAHYDGGDGTVPRVSAVPADFDKDAENLLPRYAAQQHGWLTNSAASLTAIINTILTIIAPGSKDAHGSDPETAVMLALQAPPLFGPGEPVSVQAEVTGVDAPIQVEAVVTPVSGLAEPIKVQAEVQPGAPAALLVGDLAPGLYRVTLRSRGHLAQRPDPVQSLFEVVDAAAMQIIADIA